jgi:penicillin-binding protein 1A
MDPDTTYYRSMPFTYRPDPYGNCDTNWWCVTTYDHRYLGTASVTTATVHSDNTIFAQLTLDVGPQNVAAMARELGVRTPLATPDGAYVPSLGLGAIAVSPLDMASAYATLAAGGVYSKPMAIRRVVLANGKVDSDAGWGKPDRTRVIPDGVAYAVTKVLEQNMLHGTGVGAYFGRPSAGKTGTTDNYADAWFCGYTPNLEATVWIGYPRGEIPMLSVHGSIVSGPGFPATIWKLFMESAIGGSRELDFPYPRQEAHFVPWRKQYEVGSSSGYYSSEPSAPATTTEPASTSEPTTTSVSTVAPTQPSSPPPAPTIAPAEQD